MVPLISIYPHTRELFAGGVLERRDKPAEENFQERTTIPGVPDLPDGYVFTEWLR